MMTHRGWRWVAGCLAVVGVFLTGCGEASPAGPAVVPRTSAPPVVDGVADDACWKDALVLGEFTKSGTAARPSKRIAARVTFDNDALYFAVTCDEPHPSRIRAGITVENDAVWQDDSVQIWIRTTDDRLDFDQFMVNTIDTRGWYRVRALGEEDAWRPAFEAKASVGARAWTAEFRIPFSDLDVRAPRSGDAFEVKIGRWAPTAKPPEAASWPAGARFAGCEDYATVFFAAPPGPAAKPAEAESFGPAIPLATGAAQPTVVKKLLVADCRAVRGFIGAPVDGSTESWGWDAGFYEYNSRSGGSGVEYAYRKNDGLHVRLADTDGFNAIQIRGGVRTKIYRDVPSWTGPEGGTLLAELPGHTRATSRVWFDEPVKTPSVSFFEATDGYLADVSFFRVTSDAGGLPKPETTALDGRTADFRPGVPFELAYYPTETMPLAALGLEMDVEGPPGDPIPLSIQMKDPADARRDLFDADVEIRGRGRVHLILDFPDQIVPKDAQIFLSLRSAQAFKARIPSLELYKVPFETAAPEALAYRKLLLHGMYCAMSEARPWSVWYYRDKVAEWLASDVRYVPCVQNILDALEHCRTIDRDGKDDEVRQYYEWIWRGVLRKEGKTPPFEARFDRAEGAPEWASLAHQAWLQARAVPEWWLDHRLVPTGEFGGVVGDDSDMYQNYADFVMFESDGVAARLKDAAARLARLAQEINLTDGINRRTMDPLHAYEEGLNQDALMAFWHYGDPVCLERCMASARSVAQCTVVTPAGHRHFRSQEIGAARRGDPRSDTDGHAHPLMWHPAFELVRYNLNPTALAWLREWADGWLEHMEPGKYAYSVDVAAEKVAETGKTPLYGGYGGQGSAFESLYWVTGERRYLGPFLEAYRTDERANTSPGGMVAELYQRGALDDFGDGLEKLLATDPVAYAQASGDKKPLSDALKYDITELQRYGMLYTTVECFTDRVFLYAISTATKCYTGGFATRNKYCRTHAVSYEGFGTDFAALVMQARPERFKVLLYNFAETELKGRLRLWTLSHGKYRLTAGVDADGDDRADAIDREEVVEVTRGSAVAVALSARKLSVIELVQVEKLDDERSRADLALSPLDTRVTLGRVESVAHNIGARPVAAVVVALVDAQGTVRERKNLGTLDAPIDLVPRRVAFRFDGVPADPAGWAVVIDPDDEVKEITEGNNRVELTPAPPAP